MMIRRYKLRHQPVSKREKREREGNISYYYQLFVLSIISINDNDFTIHLQEPNFH